MRLTSHQIRVIKDTAKEIFGSDVKIWVFGSRVEDRERGGDIDLYVEVDETDPDRIQRLESRFWVRLQRLLGEQRIDIVTRSTARAVREIDRQARNTGVRL